jgi:hypothetical protein
VPPGDPGAELIGGEQGRDVAALAPLDAADLLEQLQVAADRLAAVGPVLGHVDQPEHEGLGRAGHLVPLGLHEGGIVRPGAGERLADLVEHLGQAAEQRREQLLPETVQVCVEPGAGLRPDSRLVAVIDRIR